MCSSPLNICAVHSSLSELKFHLLLDISPEEAELPVLPVISVMWKVIKISMHCTKSISKLLVDWYHKKAVQLNSKKIYVTLLQSVMVWSKQSNNNTMWQQISQYVPHNLSNFGKINFSLFLALPVHHLWESYMKFHISMAKFILLSKHINLKLSFYASLLCCNVQYRHIRRHIRHCN